MARVQRPGPTRPIRQVPVEAEKPTPTAIVAVKKLFAAETPEYFLLLGATLFLLIFGLVMVLSSSAIDSLVNDGDFFARASRQWLFALIGLPLMLLAARAPMTFWRRWAWHAIGLGLALQLLVVFTGLGVGNGYNTNWLEIGPVTVQPSEFIKLALVVWLSWVLTTKAHLLHEWRHVMLPILPVAGLAIALVLVGNDLGTAVILLTIVIGALFFAGVRLRFIAVALVGVALPAWIAISASGSRSGRFEAWLAGCDPTKLDPILYDLHCWQSVNGWQALAHGGVFGVGLGNSAAKWAWLPAADNDFIFAIIGEELGLLGCLLVLAVYVVLATCLVRIIRMVREPFAKIATSVVLIWVVGQALVNIAVVLGLLPVLGVPLPLVSSGGSALITTMVAIGVVLSFARARPMPVVRDIPLRSSRIVR